MFFMKNHKKMIALVAVFSFLNLVGISSMPLKAADTREQIASASSEQGAGYLEAVAQKAVPVKKKSILPMILIGAGVVTVAAVLILVVFKAGYDIRGNWAILIDSTWEGSMTFSGEKGSGTWTNPDAWVEKATSYTVDGKNVTWTGTIYFAPGTDFKATDTYTGKFDSKDIMSGTYTSNGVYGNFTGYWVATRN
jgi:hypothetical protein